MLIHPTLIAKREVLRKLEVILARLHNMILKEVSSRLHVQLGIKELIGPALIALETFRTFPLTFWNKLQLWCPAERVKSLIAYITVK